MMNLPAPLRLGRFVVIALAVSATGPGCKQSKPSAPATQGPAAPAVADAATQGPAQVSAAVADAGTTQPTAVKPAPDTSDVTVAVDAPNEVEVPTTPSKPFDRKTLEGAYLEISCIQKKGQAAKLLAAYKKYGFADPRAWIRAWESQKKSPDYEQWLAALTQKAWKACP